MPLVQMKFLWIAANSIVAVGGSPATIICTSSGLRYSQPSGGSAIVVTIPVAFVAFTQWGISSEFGYLMGIYALIQFLDGNLLVPLLFSEVVNLHPVAIIVAVVFFGSLWGIWGVFFAIPLATLIQAIIKAWPEQETIIEKTS